MIELLTASVLWAFSFGFIKKFMGHIDPIWLSTIRLWCASLIFFPFFLKNKVFHGFWRWITLGALQFGLMYVTYISSFKYLQAHEVVLFTVLTPLWITLIHGVLEKEFEAFTFLLVVLSVGVSFWLVYSPIRWREIALGFLWVQASNICFGLGQVLFIRWKHQFSLSYSPGVFFLLFFGGFFISLLLFMLKKSPYPPPLNTRDYSILIYLSLFATTVGFYVWNKGLLKVSAGTVAIFNNLKIPLGMVVSLVFFDGKVNFFKLIISSMLMVIFLALHENKRQHR